MKAKAFGAIMLTLSLVAMMFIVPVRAPNPEVKIGIMGPMGLIQGIGMKEGAELVADDWGWTVDVGGVPHTIVLNYYDEFQGGDEGTGPSGLAAMTELVGAGNQFAIGGFRSESTFGARDYAMQWHIPFLVTGAATNSIIWDPSAGVEPNIATDRDLYKYIFRITPVNSTTLMKELTGIYYLGAYGFLTYLLEKMMPLYGDPIKFAAVIENLVWADGFWTVLTNPYYTYLYLGPHATLATDPGIGPAAYHVSPTLDDFSAVMAGIKRSEARLIIQILSAETAGRAFTLGLRDSGVKAVAAGINVEEQMSESWAETEGAVEYQMFLQASGTRTPLSTESIPFWDAYVAKWGHDPIYTAYGAAAGLLTLLEAIERAGTIDPDAGPGHYVDGVYEGELIKQLELTDALRATTNFKFTGPNGIYHDVWSGSFGAEWPDGYSRSLVTQWQAGRQEVVWPMDEWPGAPGKYCKLLALPAAHSTTQFGWTGGLMYPYRTDITQDAKVDMDDVSKVGLAYGTSPGDARWQFLADMPTCDWTVVDKDHSDPAAGVMSVIDPDYLPLPYCNEAGHLVRYVP